MATVEQIAAAVARADAAGVKRHVLAAALGKNREGTLSEWLTRAKTEPNKVTRLPLAELERVVAELTSGRAPVSLDPRSYTAGLLVGLEGDARRILGRIAEARAALGLATTRPSASLEDGDEGRGGLGGAGAVRRRKKG
jgi:hypothetical protein